MRQPGLVGSKATKSRLWVLLFLVLSLWALLSAINSRELHPENAKGVSSSQATHEFFLESVSSKPVSVLHTHEPARHVPEPNRGAADHVRMQEAARSMNSRYGHESFVACTTIRGIDKLHCVAPEIQVQGKWKVFLIAQDSPKKGFRFHHLVQQGLELHPAVTVVHNLDDADVAFYIPTCTKFLPVFNTSSEIGSVHNALTPKLIILDEGDGPGHVRSVKDGEYLAYFKRSWVRKNDGVFYGTPPRFTQRYYPMTYSVSTNYTNGLVLTRKKYDVVCTLRLNPKQPARRRVLGWTTDVVSAMGRNQTSVLGQVNSAQRRTISNHYLDVNREARIIVTCNPSLWEGDFRLWEAMASGALVFVDHMYTPVHQPLVDGLHVVLYNPTDEMAFKSKLRYYMDHPHEAQEIALRGYFHVLRYHRSVSRIDYILRSTHALLQKAPTPDDGSASSLKYIGTAQDLVRDEPKHVRPKRN